MISLGQLHNDRHISAPGMLIEVLRWLSNAHCRLTRLVLRLEFCPDVELLHHKLDVLRRLLLHSHGTGAGISSEGDDVFEAPVTQFASDTSITRALANLDVSKEIIIQLEDLADNGEVTFKEFVTSIAMKKGWKYVTEQDDRSSGVKWVLQPAGKIHTVQDSSGSCG